MCVWWVYKRLRWDALTVCVCAFPSSGARGQSGEPTNWNWWIWCRVVHSTEHKTTISLVLPSYSARNSPITPSNCKSARQANEVKIPAQFDNLRFFCWVEKFMSPWPIPIEYRWHFDDAFGRFENQWNVPQQAITLPNWTFMHGNHEPPERSTRHRRTGTVSQRSLCVLKCLLWWPKWNLK